MTAHWVTFSNSPIKAEPDRKDSETYTNRGEAVIQQLVNGPYTTALYISGMFLPIALIKKELGYKDMQDQLLSRSYSPANRKERV